MKPDVKDFLMHYGMPKRSGRYPWGSGGDPNQHGGDFLSRVSELKGKGLGDTEIAKSMGLSTTQYRVQKSLANDSRRSLDVATAQGLRDKGFSLNEITSKMGFKNDSSVRSLLNVDSKARMNEAQKTADFLEKQIKEKGMIDVGTGVERELGISKEKLKQALYMLEIKGYPTFGGGVPQVTNPGRQTNIKVICPPGTQHKDIYQFENVHSLRDYVSHDDGQHFDTYHYPASLNSKRLKVRYAEDGGLQKDGVIELRRNVDDLSLGNSHYAQVRILVDGSHYLKGMAVYSDHMPEGTDIIFNTNKKRGTPVLGDKSHTVLKNIKNDPDNPFGSTIKANGQHYYIDKDGKRKLSLINKAREEGDWKDWSNSIPSQFLSKQNLPLIKRQLGLAVTDKLTEYNEIRKLTNPTVKKVLLKSFADDCDSAAIHLHAAALPRQKYQVLIPVPSLKDNEVYAPNFNSGEQIALIRYPHGGTFEIPILTVNNKQQASIRLLGHTPADAIGINSKVAERLSGADFDGDTVMAIPTGGKVKITSTPPLKGLEGFDPKMSYPERKGMKYMHNTQTEMGKISNLITDMTLKGANQDELARAVRHSMVVIDAEKHRLDYKQSEINNGISGLKKKYQGTIDASGHYHEGASTLLSRSKSEVQVLKRKGSPRINDPSKSWYDPKKPVGSLLWNSVHEEYVDKKGHVKERTQSSTKMAETTDARSLSSGNPKEEVYANFANSMKALGNQARKELISTGKIKYSPSAKETYHAEVTSLMGKRNVALKNAPRERMAQVLANAAIKAKVQDNPDMSNAEIKKAKQKELNDARNSVGASHQAIKITSEEWKAIQSGAISENVLTQIINNTDIDNLRQLATPRAMKVLSAAKISKISAMDASGHTTSEIAKALGISTSTVYDYLNGEE